MTIDDFWDLIRRSATATSEHDRTAWLTERLARLPAAQIIEFELHLTTQRRRADTRLMWGAAWYIMQGWCSGDSFWYFQPWLVGLGRDVFDRVAAHPDALAQLPQVRRLAGRARSEWSDDEWPQWELLNYVAVNAYQHATGQEDGLDQALEARGHYRVCDAAPEDEPWDYDDPEQRRARFPRLTELIG
ncbi:DUF4240 domain-containing protein [Plantactinospora endophytica]|uniref:DUF4240 domain-containing protein n=1 Tax=Plantactinospora endophytica TaxID=673535 RepID=A0ABQ4EEF3_9ACTN|nr:DUF4240 domain-containing protein [Plantactinospora endophytica]GIG93090.1 hypothetical protein Pen02_80260 [Plantactinospora endophytica]